MSAITFDINVKLDQLRAGMASVRAEADRTKREIESKPIKLQLDASPATKAFQAELAGLRARLETAASTLQGLRSSSAQQFSGGGGSGALFGSYFGGASVIAGTPMTRSVIGAIQNEAAMLGIGMEDRRRFAATGGGRVAPASSGGLTSALGSRSLIRLTAAAAIGEGLVSGALASGDYTDSRIRENRGDMTGAVRMRLRANDRLAGIPIVGTIANSIAESISGTSSEKITQGLAKNQEALKDFVQVIKQRRRANEAAGVEADQIDASTDNSPASKMRAIRAASQAALNEVEIRVQDKLISSEAGAKLKTAIKRKTEKQLVQISDEVFDNAAELFNENRLIEVGRTGDTRAVARARIEQDTSRRVRIATRNGGDVAGETALGSARLVEFDRQNAAEIKSIEIQLQTAIELTKAQSNARIRAATEASLQSEIDAVKEASRIKIKAYEDEAAQVENIDKEKASKLRNQAQTEKIDSEGQVAALQAQAVRRAGIINEQTDVMRITRQRGAFSGQIESIRVGSNRAVAEAAGSPELHAALRGQEAEQLLGIQRQLHSSVDV